MHLKKKPRTIIMDLARHMGKDHNNNNIKYTEKEITNDDDDNDNGLIIIWLMDWINK